MFLARADLNRSIGFIVNGWVVSLFGGLPSSSGGTVVSPKAIVVSVFERRGEDDSGCVAALAVIEDQIEGEYDVKSKSCGRNRKLFVNDETGTRSWSRIDMKSKL